MLLMHGWPGSVFEFKDIIPRLTDPARFGGDPADAFTVVAPSLPGYCRFAAQGGDWGGITASRMGYAHADKLIGIHVNLLASRRDISMVSNPTPEERTYLGELTQWLKEETGYQWIQGTRPHTLSFTLTDSPAGLAARIVEKFRAWSDCDGDVESAITRDQLLANIPLLVHRRSARRSSRTTSACIGHGRSPRAAGSRCRPALVHEYPYTDHYFVP
jgi:microsomal epoxide hydrolase